MVSVRDTATNLYEVCIRLDVVVCRYQAICLPDLQYDIHQAAQPQLSHADPQQPESIYLQGLWPQVQTS